MRLNWGTAPLGPFEFFEICLVLLCVVLAFVRPTFASRWFSRVEAMLSGISEHRWLCALILFLFPISLRLLLIPVYGPPAPFISDEYAYLLQADTFASGRWTNPSPSLPQHFTSIYVLTEPTYTAEYQIGQGLMLAIGQVLTGLPWAGVVLSMGLLCALLYWALLAWLPPHWAFAGTAIVVSVQISVLSYWMNSYWGGCVPAIGGTLTLGALPRIRDRNPILFTSIAAAGLFVLLNSRPLEGLLLSVVVAGTLAYCTFFSKQLSLPVLTRQIIPVLVTTCAVTVAFAGFYNRRVTGRATEFPYMLYKSGYGVPQGFFWQRPVIAPHPMPADIRAEYEDQLRQHERRKSLKALIGATGGKLRRFWEFYIGIPLSLTLLFLPFIWRSPEMRLALWTLLLVLGLDNLLFFAYFPHYSAPVTVLIVLVVIQCIRRMRATGQAGLFLSRALPVVCALGLMIPVCGRLYESLLPPKLSPVKKLWQSEFAHDVSRELFVPQLERESGRQLVLVRYKTYNGEKKFEWIFNRADIENAKIVWARDSGNPESTRQLLQHFAGRKIWLAEPDASPPRIAPFPVTQ